jgi:hypothetical protein
VGAEAERCTFPNCQGRVKNGKLMCPKHEGESASHEQADADEELEDR